MTNIWEDIIQIEKQMDSALATLRQNGTIAAEKERAYRIAKAKLTLKLKSDGMPITIISDIVKGDEDVSLLAMERDIAMTNYKCNLEALHVKQQEYSMYKVYFDKEYSIGKD